MNKDVWDKLGIVATFVQIVVIGGFTALVSFYTSKMTNKLDTYKTGMDESQMISKLVTDLSMDTNSNIKVDFALLSLERYLKSSQNGIMRDYDRKMLVGFAQSIILERFSNTRKIDLDDKLNEILVERNFLQQNDTTAYTNILNIISASGKQTNYPERADNPATLDPVNIVNDSASTKAMGVLFNKTCYIQYADTGLQKEAKNIQQKLNGKSWYAPGVEKVPGNYRSLIKYFHSEDEDLANMLKTSLGDGYKNIDVIQVKNFKGKVPRSQLELWIGKSN